MANDEPVSRWEAPALQLAEFAVKNDFKNVHAFFLDNRKNIVDICSHRVSSDLVIVKDSKLTVLHVTSRLGQLNFMTFMIKNGISVNVKDTQGLTALDYAALNNECNSASLLLEKGANVDNQDKYGRTALYGASQRGHIKMVRLLLENGANTNIAQEEGVTPLMIATHSYKERSHHLDITKLLIEFGANLDVSELANNCTALHIATCEGFTVVARLLVKKGAILDLKTKNGYTPLMCAARYGFLDIAKCLLHHHADINLQNKHGYTALMLSLKEEHPDVAEVIVFDSADVYIVNKSGKRARHYAKTPHMKGLLEDAELTQAPRIDIPPAPYLGSPTRVSLTSTSLDFLEDV